MNTDEIRLQLARKRMTRKTLAGLLGISYDRCIRIVNDYTEPTARERRLLRCWLGDGGRKNVGRGSRAEQLADR